MTHVPTSMPSLACHFLSRVLLQNDADLLEACCVPSACLFHLFPGPALCSSCHLPRAPAWGGCFCAATPLSPGKQGHRPCMTHIIPFSLLPRLVSDSSPKVDQRSATLKLEIFKFYLFKDSWNSAIRAQLFYFCVFFSRFVFTHKHNDHITVNLVSDLDLILD